jgi:ribosomal protein S18 acetylase RimI-like enzyme
VHTCTLGYRVRQAPTLAVRPEIEDRKAFETRRFEIPSTHMPLSPPRIESVDEDAIERLDALIQRYQDENAVVVREDQGSLRAALGYGGRAFIATGEAGDMGCVVVRPTPAEPAACEMKRLYVVAQHRGTGVGRALVETLLAEAAAMGYRVVLLDTADGMDAAQHLYERLGFRDCAPYNDNPQASRFMRLVL